MDERSRDPIHRLAQAYTRVLHEYGDLLRLEADDVTAEVRARRADLARQLAELNTRLEALNRTES